MTTAFWILAVFLATTAYLSAGFFFARGQTDRLWRNAVRDWTSESNRKKSARRQFIALTILWPFFGLGSVAEWAVVAMVKYAKVIPNPHLIKRFDAFLEARRPQEARRGYY